MHPKLLTRLIPFIFLLSLTVASPPLWAQTEPVYVTNSSNNRILRITAAHFVDPTLLPLVVNEDANQRKQLQGLVARELDELIVCDTADGKVLFYDLTPDNGEVIGQTISELIALPDGVSLSPDGTLYLISSGPGSGKDKTPEVWMIPPGEDNPGGYGKAVPIDSAPDAELLEDTKVVRVVPEGAGTPYSAGDLLVLSRKPGKVLLYEGAAPCDSDVTCAQPLIENLNGMEPTGFDFDPDGYLLISTLGGTILRYGYVDDEPEWKLTTLAEGLGNGKFKLSVGIQGVGEPLVFVTNRNGGEVIRLKFDGDQLVELEDDFPVTAGVQYPVGVAAVTNNAALISQDGQTAFFQNLSATFESVGEEGLDDISCISFVDPRESLTVALDYQPLENALRLNDPLIGLPPAVLALNLPVEIPPYVRGFPTKQPGDQKNGPNTGLPVIRLCITDTTAELAGVVEFDAEDSTVEHACDLPSARYLEGRMFYAPETSPPKLENPMIEGDNFNGDPVLIDRFKDITVLCGSHRAWGRGRRSLILETVRDVRPLNKRPTECLTEESLLSSPNCDIISFKLHQLKRALTRYGIEMPNGEEPVRGGLAHIILLNTRDKLLAKLDQAIRDFERGNVKNLIRRLDEFLSIVESSTFDEEFVRGELKERAASTIFMACKFIKGKKKPDACKLCILQDDPHCQP